MSKTPNPVDVHVGGRLRLRRTLLGYSQERLGDAVELTFQQIQKYERGANRISASRLYQFANVLNVPVSFFYDDMDESISGKKAHKKSEPESIDQSVLLERETLVLVRSYYGIPDPSKRRCVAQLIRSIAQMDN